MNKESLHDSILSIYCYLLNNNLTKPEGSDSDSNLCNCYKKFLITVLLSEHLI